jgi:2-polyprenyl-3-methyl-5-hydroxy-6-metoxy-1,4-benzoquinol methylase
VPHRGSAADPTETPANGDGPAAEASLEHSWRANAAAWSDAVRERRIASRRVGTDAAIVDAVLHMQPRRVLDLGCGEGWLARTLGARGIEVVGVDASPELVESARALGGAQFETTSYAGLASRRADLGRFDAAVFNFALLAEDLRTPLQATRALLAPRGRLLVQTVHPWIARGDAPYIDGWRIETFEDFGGAFKEPMPWYFRTLASWSAAIRDNGFAVERWIEPVDSSGTPLSLLLVAAIAPDPAPSKD